MLYGNRYYVWLGQLPLPSTVELKFIHEILMEAIISNIRVNGIKIKIYKRTDKSEQALYIVIVSLSPDCIMGMDIVSHWGMFPLTRFVKQKAHKSALQAILIEHANKTA